MFRGHVGSNERAGVCSLARVFADRLFPPHLWLGPSQPPPDFGAVKPFFAARLVQVARLLLPVGDIDLSLGADVVRQIESNANPSRHGGAVRLAPPPSRHVFPSRNAASLLAAYTEPISRLSHRRVLPKGF